ncbi:MAG: YceI family protein [Myxococcales bacterium]|nr:YceI family protein [Myxococcales bacterium]
MPDDDLTARRGPAGAQCSVYTFKEGALSRLAHDLHLSVAKMEVKTSANHDSVSAEFDAASLEVVGARQGGRDLPGVIGPADCRKIEETIRREVLESGRYPFIRFESEGVVPDGAEYQIDGVLDLHGVRRPCRVRACRGAGAWIGRASINQRDFGISPYRAALGTLRVREIVEIEVRVPYGEDHA